jgi:hypothetical protein
MVNVPVNRSAVGQLDTEILEKLVISASSFNARIVEPVDMIELHTQNFGIGVI